jgi:hypothetical protein
LYLMGDPGTMRASDNSILPTGKNYNKFAEFIGLWGMLG